MLSFRVKSNKFICNCDLKSADSRVQDFMMAELEALEASEGLKADLLKMNESGPAILIFNNLRSFLSSDVALFTKTFLSI